MNSRSHRRRWAIGVLLAVVIGTIASVALYFNPFWFLERATYFYFWKKGVQSREILVQGHRIHYLEARPPTGSQERPVILIHGLGARASDWGRLIPELAHHGFHIYALDLLGYGDSEKPIDGDFSLSAEEHLVAGFIEALRLPQADVAGWSMGGWIAMKYALDSPEKVRRLLLFDAAGLYMPVNFPLNIFAPSDQATLNRLIHAIEPEKPFLHVPSVVVPGLIRRFQKNSRFVNNSLASMLDGREILDFRAYRLSMPVLILWGTEDKLIPVSSGWRLHSLIEHSVFVGIPGCGHLAIVECSSAAIPKTLEFLTAANPLPRSAQILPPVSR